MTLAYQFGRFELRPAARQLLVDQQSATLGASAFDLLVALLERRDRLVTKDELLELVWPVLIVDDENGAVVHAGAAAVTHRPAARTGRVAATTMSTARAGRRRVAAVQ